MPKFTSALMGPKAGWVTLLGVGVLLSGCDHKPAGPPPGPPEVGVVTIESQAVTANATLPGRTNPMLTSDVRPQVNGVIKARLFTEGTDVKAGQVLYQIDPAPYVAALDQAKGLLANARAALTTAKLKADRYADLVKANAVSRQDNDDALAAYQQAEATVLQQKAAVEAAQVNVDYTRIIAPISGRIGRSLATPGALAVSGQTTALATIQKLDPIYVDLTESSDELLELKRALAGGTLASAGPDSAQVKLVLAGGEAYPLEGQLKFSEVTVDQTTGSVTLRAVFPNPHAVLLPGMFVRAVLNQGVYKQGILAPQQGVSHDPKGGATALVVGPDGKVEARILKTAGAYGDRWLVTDGLKPGDKLIVEGLLKVQPGMTVKAVPAKPAGETAAGPPAPGAGG
jgi:membrane fusion protein (multidrug efflux system)